jgi:hypothetical protein
MRDGKRFCEMRRKRRDGKRLQDGRRQLRRRQMSCGRERTHVIVLLAPSRIVRRQVMRAVYRTDDERRVAGSRQVGHPPDRQNRAQEHGAQRKRYGKGSEDRGHGRKIRL